MVCPKCGAEEELFVSLGKVGLDKAACPACGGATREVVTFYKVRGAEPFLDRTLAGIGVPPFDVLIARTADRAVGLELAADAAAVLGPLPPLRSEPPTPSSTPSMDEAELEWT